MAWLSDRRPDWSRGELLPVVVTDATDGTLLTQVSHTAPPHSCREPSISADGRFVVFASNGNLAVFAIASDGTLSPLGEPLSGLKEPTGVAIVNVP